MKIAIATFVRAYNYGAVLQAYALNRVINEMGADCETVDYYPEYFNREYNMTELRRIKKPTIHIRSRIKSDLNNAKVYEKAQHRSRKFNRFIKKYIKLTKRTYRNLKELERSLPEYDAIIAGSDQIWRGGLTKFDTFFYLDFKLPEGTKKYSYAASFGFPEIDKEHEDDYRKKLSGYEKYSVREMSGVKILYDLLGVNAAVNCDPVLLLNNEQWSEIASVKKEKGKYILLYSISYYSDFFQFVSEYAKNTKLKVICVMCSMDTKTMLKTNFKRDGFDFDVRLCTSPEEFISLFENAEYVMAASFHGTLFSLLFHKNFTTLISDKNGFKNNRAMEFLTETGLSNRGYIYGEAAQIQPVDSWENADKKIQMMRDEAKEYIKSILNH